MNAIYPVFLYSNMDDEDSVYMIEGPYDLNNYMEQCNVNQRGDFEGRDLKGYPITLYIDDELSSKNPEIYFQGIEARRIEGELSVDDYCSRLYKQAKRFHPNINIQYEECKEDIFLFYDKYADPDIYGHKDEKNPLIIKILFSPFMIIAVIILFMKIMNDSIKKALKNTPKKIDKTKHEEYRDMYENFINENESESSKRIYKKYIEKIDRIKADEDFSIDDIQEYWK